MRINWDGKEGGGEQTQEGKQNRGQGRIGGRETERGKRKGVKRASLELKRSTKAMLCLRRGLLAEMQATPNCVPAWCDVMWSYRCVRFVLTRVGPDSSSVQPLYRLASCVCMLAKQNKTKKTITCKDMPVSHGIANRTANRPFKINEKYRLLTRSQQGGILSAKPRTDNRRLPSIGLLFGCAEADEALLLVTLKLAGRVSDTPKDIPLMSLGLNFFLHDGARRKFLSSSWNIEDSRRKKKKVGFRSFCLASADVLCRPSPLPTSCWYQWPASCCTPAQELLWPRREGEGH